MRLRGRELLWSLTRHFVNMLLYSDISEPGERRSAPTPTKGLADLPFLRPWERYQGEGLQHPEQDRGQECGWKPSVPVEHLRACLVLLLNDAPTST